MIARSVPRHYPVGMPHSSPCSRLLAALVPLAAVAALGGCGRTQQDTPAAATSAPAAAEQHATTSESHLPPGIDWFPGDVDAAFAAAKSAPKPLFLYWGAEWCPPCAQIKATIFNRREFQERSRLFVPVYLDGDVPSAQKQAEHFGVVGYPTMILFRPDGTEITRLPGGVDIERYAKILDVALADARPVKEIVAAATSGGEVSRNDWQLLAYYDWAADNGRALPGLPAVACIPGPCRALPVGHGSRLRKALLRVPGRSGRSRSDGKPPLSGLDRAIARKKLVELLDSPAVDRANVQNLLYASQDRDRAAIRCQQRRAARAHERMGFRAGPGECRRRRRCALRRRPAETAQGAGDARAARRAGQAAATGAAGPDPADRSARRTRRRPIPTRDRPPSTRRQTCTLRRTWTRTRTACWSPSSARPSRPTTSCSTSPTSPRRRDARTRPCSGSVKAYAGAQGPATRFQWGYSYLVGLLEMTPEDAKKIETVGLRVIGELGEDQDAFYQRTRLRLDQLSAKLLDWGQSGDAAKVVEKLRNRTTRDLRRPSRGRRGPRQLRAFPQARFASHARRVIEYLAAARSVSSRPWITSSG